MTRDREPRSAPARFEALEDRRLFAAGALDLSFSEDGKFSLRFGQGASTPHTLFAEAVAVQSDGKTIVAGTYARVGGGGSSNFALARLNFDGTLDASFGPKEHRGVALAHLGKEGGFNVVNAVAIQPDGRIVVAGGATRARTGRSDEIDMAVARFLPSGALDKSFSQDGMRFVEFGNASAADIALQKDGKIVLAGTRTEGLVTFDEDFAVVRLNRDGGLDNTFDKDGVQTVELGGLEEARAVAIDHSGTAATNPNFGKIIVVGGTGDFKDEHLALARLNTNGSRDATFGKGGVVKARIPGIDEVFARDVLVQSDGKMVVYAEIDSDPREGFRGTQAALLRYLPNGELDGTFGGAGTGIIEERFGPFHTPAQVIQSSSGGLITGSFTNSADFKDSKFTLTGYTADGLVDKRFGKDGRATTSFGADGSASRGGIAKGPGNRIVMAGGSVFKTARFLEGRNNVISVVAVNPPADLQAAETVPGQKRRTASFIVDRSEALPVPTRVFFNISGTAINNVDYTTNLSKVLQSRSIIGIGTGTVKPAAPAPGQAFIDIPAGKTFVTVTITPKDDRLLEVTETARFSIVPNAKYEVSSLNSITTSIADNNDPILINFQTPGAAPAEYVADVGRVFGDRGNGLTYGWDADNTANVRNRDNPGSLDERFDTLALMQKDGANRTWEIALANGMYSVQLDVGDPSFTDSVYNLDLENRLAISGTPSGQTRWFERAFNVEVKDGRLTLSNNAAGVNNKIAFINIVRAAPGAVEGPTTGNLPADLAPPPTTAAKPVALSRAPRIFSQLKI